MNEYSSDVTREYEKFLLDNFERAGYKFEHASYNDAISYLEDGNNTHYFVNKKYAFSTRAYLEYSQDGLTYKHNVSVDSYYDDSMVDYIFDDAEEN